MFCRLVLMLTFFACWLSVLAVVVQFGDFIFVVLGLVLIVAILKGRVPPLTAFGTARWANADNLRRSGMLGASRGLIIGRMLDGNLSQAVLRDLFDWRVPSKRACEQVLALARFRRKAAPSGPLVRLPDAIHTAVIARTGTGKNASCATPFLLTSDESAVVVDFKGESFRLTAKHRAKAFGHRIVVLDPFGVVTDVSDTYNPLAFIASDARLAIDDARSLAESIVIRTGHEHDLHWINSAEAWIAALIALVVYYAEPADRSLQTVRTLLTNPEKLELAIRLMCSSDAWGGMLARMGHQLTQFKDKELASTLTTTNRFLRFLDTLAVSSCTAQSSFNPAELRGGKMTIYMILPPEFMRTQSPLLRLWIGSFLRAVVQGEGGDSIVHFVLDEAASLGHMEAIDDALQIGRSYHIRLQFYFQSMAQLRKAFPDGQDQTLLSNVSQVFFGVNDLQTAEYVSNRLGESTTVLRSGGNSTGTSKQESSRGESSYSSTTSENNNWALHGRKLLKPEEVLALPDRVAITFTPHVPPVCTRLIRYYEESLGQHHVGKWRQMARALHCLVASSSLLLCAVLMMAEASQIRLPRFVPNRFHQRTSIQKGNKSWRYATSSR